MSASETWIMADRADARACALADRHYPRRASSRGKGNCAGPGRVLVLVTEDARAFWVSRAEKPVCTKHAWPGSWVCAAFRNEGAGRASRLIRSAVAATMAVWGGGFRRWAS